MGLIKKEELRYNSMDYYYKPNYYWYSIVVNNEFYINYLNPYHVSEYQIINPILNIIT